MSRIPLAIVCAALVVAACGSVPLRNSVLEDARATVAGVGPASDLSPEARAELERATQALRAAEMAHARKESGETVAHLAYVARQRAVLARELDALRRTEQQTDAAAAARERELIEARNRATEAQQRAQQQAAAAEQRAARLQQQLQQSSRPIEQPLTDAQRQAIVEAARRAALQERLEREMRARSAAKLARSHKPGRTTRSDTARADKEPPNIAAAESGASKTASAATSTAQAPAAAPAPSVKEDDRPRAAAAATEAQRAAGTSSAPRAKPVAGSVLTLNDESFHPGAPYLRPGVTRSLDPVADFLRAHADRKVRITSFAPGPERELSRGRANEVRDALLRRGVAAGRIQVVEGSGSGGGAARVEIVVSDERGRTAAR